ncbi:MAG: hypothetical protein FWC61_00850 [Proteobacteria bacterium]|nr:hypothetical protein [Pseudomonadota bacterium]
MFKFSGFSAKPLHGTPVNPADLFILPDGRTLAQRNDERRPVRNEISKKRDQIIRADCLNEAEKKKLLSENSYATLVPSITYSTDVNKLINGNRAQVGVAVIDGRVVFSDSANNFPLETRWDGKNDLQSGGKVIYQNWLVNNFADRMEFCTENSAFKNTDWEFAIQISAPYNAKVQPEKYGEIVENPTFGKESIYGCTMLWLRNKKTGELARLIADETKWLSCSSWSNAFGCARGAARNAGSFLSPDYDLWAAVWRLAEQRVKELAARKR